MSEGTKFQAVDLVKNIRSISSSAAADFSTHDDENLWHKTNNEQNPWVILDLSNDFILTRTDLYVRGSIGSGAERKSPLDFIQLRVSLDGLTWQELSPTTRRSRSVHVETCVPARFLRIDLNAHAPLHIERVALFGMPRRQEAKNCEIDLATSTLYCIHNAGLFSLASVILESISLANTRHIPVARIDLSRGGFRYKERSDLNRDLWADLFAPPSGVMETKRGPRLKIPPQSPFRDFAFDRMRPLVAHYFRLSETVAGTVSAWRDRYGIDFDRTLAVYYRGTDKFVDMTIGEPSRYVQQAQEILRATEAERILIQTDDGRVRELFKSVFSERCFFLDDLPVSTDGVGIHRVALQDPTVSAQNLLAAVSLVSRCRYILNSSGNMAAWMAILRGDAKNLWQFDKDANVLPPYEDAARPHDGPAFADLDRDNRHA